MTTPTVRETAITREGTRIMPDNAPHNALRHYVTGAIERGEAEPITAIADDTPHTYTSALDGRRAVTRHGEYGVIIGRALDPARCKFQPDNRGTEYFTPRIVDLTLIGQWPVQTVAR
jgi:hypothetical protein